MSSISVAVDSVLKRMTIIGVILSFRSLAQEALRDVSCYPDISSRFSHMDSASTQWKDAVHLIAEILLILLKLLKRKLKIKFKI